MFTWKHTSAGVGRHKCRSRGPLAQRLSLSAFPRSGELSLLMLSTRDVSLLHAWIPDSIDREHPPEPLAAEAASINTMLLEGTRPMTSGKLRVKSGIFWRSQYVSLFTAGQLLISDATGTRPLHVVNLQGVPVLRSRADLQLTVISMVGAVHLRSGDSDAKARLDVWALKIEIATGTNRALEAHSVGGGAALVTGGAFEDQNVDFDAGETSVGFANAVRKTFSAEATAAAPPPGSRWEELSTGEAAGSSADHSAQAL